MAKQETGTDVKGKSRKIEKAYEGKKGKRGEGEKRQRSDAAGRLGGPMARQRGGEGLVLAR